jgi:hypothetical protein
VRCSMDRITYWKAIGRRVHNFAHVDQIRDRDWPTLSPMSEDSVGITMQFDRYS